jgi:hypothetical protein
MVIGFGKISETHFAGNGACRDILGIQAMKKRGKLDKWRPYFAWDLHSTGLLPIGWEQEVSETVQHSGFGTVLTGDGSTSREKRIGQHIPVRVVEGTSIKNELPWLWSLYTGPLLEFSSTSFNRKLFPSIDVKSAVNINHIFGEGARYEWHVDSNPVTGLLFVSTCLPKEGGALVFRDAKNKRNSIVRAQSGVFICFDARQIAHRVAPLKGTFARTSIPMNYYESASDQMRPSDLEAQIYTATDV